MAKFRGGRIQQVLLNQPYHTDPAIDTAGVTLIPGIEVEPSGSHKNIGMLRDVRDPGHVHGRATGPSGGLLVTSVARYQTVMTGGKIF